MLRARHLEPAAGVAVAGLLAATIWASCRPTPAQDPAPSTEGSGAPAVELPEIDSEPNDRPDQAAPLTRSGHGRLGRGDVDVYQLEPALHDWRLHLAARPSGSAALAVATASEAMPDSARWTVVYALRGDDSLVFVRGLRNAEVTYDLWLEPLELPDLGELLAEPNHRDSAPTIDAVPARVAGFYDGPGDRDSVFINRAALEEATTLEISAVAGARPLLELWTPDGRQLTTMAASRSGVGTGIPNLAIPPDVERIRLDISNGEQGASRQPYTVSLHRPQFLTSALAEREPNDQLELAQPIFEGTSRRANIDGLLHRADDIDWYHLRLTEEAAVTLALTPTPTADVALTWHGGGGVDLTQDLSGPGEPESLCARIAPPGEHRIEVAARSVSGEALAGYTLTGRIETGAFEREPNDTPNVAQLQYVRAGEMSGYLESEGDVDVFGLRLIGLVDAPRDQAINVVPPAGVDLAVEVEDERGGAVVPRTDRAGRGQAERVVVPRQSTTYRLILRAGRRGGYSCEAPYRIELE